MSSRSPVSVPRLARLATAALLTIAVPASAARQIRSVAEQSKIDFLIGEVRGSPAIFIRNGREYRASRAASHLLSKLGFAGKRVQTAEQFIAGIASRSETTGKPYEIRWPDGRRQRLAEWLLDRLDYYEKEHLPASDTPARR